MMRMERCSWTLTPTGKLSIDDDDDDDAEPRGG